MIKTPEQRKRHAEYTKNYYQTHRKEHREAANKWYHIHRKEVAERFHKRYHTDSEFKIKINERTLKNYHKYYLQNPEKIKIRKARWEKRNPEKVRVYALKQYHKIKKEVFAHYTNNTFKCACCGESEYVFLCLDHINNDGAEHRRKISGKNNRTFGIYAWLRKNKFPVGFQVLCHNCNWAKSHGGCPHKLVAD